MTDQIQCAGVCVCVHEFTVCASFRVRLTDENSDLGSSAVINVCLTRESGLDDLLPYVAETLASVLA